MGASRRSEPIDVYDVAIVGAGPSGLAAAHALRHRGRHVLIIENGKSSECRGRWKAEEISNGVGGAGLFSDGKFAFFPAATQLWALKDQEALMRAYLVISSWLSRFGLIPPEFPSSYDGGPSKWNGWRAKQYSAVRLNFKDRLCLIKSLTQETTCEWELGSSVVDISHVRGENPPMLLRIDSPRSTRALIGARALILATGRMGALESWMKSFPMIFRRLEVGVRIEQQASDTFFNQMPGLDPKLILSDKRRETEWRTFCACKNGEAVVTNCRGIWSVSGRADGPPTNRSNIGFNVRLLNEAQSSALLGPLVSRLRSHEAIFRVSLTSVLERHENSLNVIETTFGPELVRHLLTGLHNLAARYPSRLDTGVLIGPAIEGVGSYPALDSQLQLSGLPVWGVGDVTGIFRGLLAAMVSGYYGGVAADAYLRQLQFK